ncbi:MAG: glycoside hydrolase family 13 protein [Clostridia bacterium]|nr:glycoside hydrolase family 13 protein [Clostridia bacterium]
MLAIFKQNENAPRIEKRCGGEDVSALGAFPRGSVIEIMAHIPRCLGVTRAELCIRRDTLAPSDSQRDPSAQKFGFEFISTDYVNDEYKLSLDTAALCGESDSGLFYYTYIFRRGGEELVASTTDNVNFELVTANWNEFRLTVYRPEYRVPSWLGGGVMYHIFLDRFAKGEGKVSYRADSILDSDWENGVPQYAEYRGAEVKNNHFFGGNLWGIIEKLDYLESLGVNILYLSPIFDAVSNHKYDTSDYLKIADEFGGEEAFKALIKAAHARGMKIILDGVFNHTGSDSRYFDEYGRYGLPARDESSPYHSWYDFHAPEKDGAPDYTAWWGIRILPRLNTHTDSCREFFTGEGGVAEHYMSEGIDGFRLDVADELPDRFLEELRDRIHSVNPESVLIGEVWENAADKIAYGKRRSYFRGAQLDSVMNYPTRKALLEFAENGNAEALASALTELYSSYPRCVSASLMNLIGTHDTERVLTILGNPEKVRENAYAYNAVQEKLRLTDEERARGVKLLKMISAFQFTLFGFPCIYYGDEAGMEGMSDPFCRYPFPWHNIDTEINEHYKKLGALRRGEKIFAGGEFKITRATGGYFEFIRYKKEEKGYVLVAVNMADEPIKVYAAGGINLYTGKRVVGYPSISKGEFIIVKMKGEVKNGLLE